MARLTRLSTQKVVSMKRTSSLFLLLALASITLFSQAQDWQPAVSGRLPALSTPVGYTSAGGVVFLARSVKAGRASLGWFDADTGKAILIEGDKSIPASNFDIYAGAGRWVAAQKIPEVALSAGKGADGQPAFILRVSSGAWLIPAVYSASDEAAVAFIDGKRTLFGSFEVLVPDWASSGDGNAVRQGFVSAKDSNGSALLPFRATQGSGLHPGKFAVTSRTGWISYGGKEIVVQDPKSEIFIGSGVWQAFKGQLPQEAIRGGYDNDGSALYMIRAKQAGAQALGKYNAARGEAYIPYGGNEIKVTSFEVLIYDLGRNREDSIVLAPNSNEAPASAASYVDDAIRTSGLRSVLSLDFNQEAQDLSPARASTSTRNLSFGSVPGTNYAVFDGRDATVDVDYPNDINLSRFTVLVRVKSALNKTWEAIINNRGWTESNMHFQFHDSQLEFALNGNNPTNVDLNYGFRPGQWYQIVLVYDMRARSAAIYVDGAKAGDYVFEKTVPYSVGSMEVGAWDGEDRFFSGQIDYLYVLNGIMSERDILSSFQSHLSGGS